MREILKHEAPLPLSEGQIETFCRFGEALLEQNKVMNLTAITEPGAVARLHFVDCMALLPLADLRGKAVIDVGCGAGFPGVPLKIYCPELKVTLMDSLGKRLRFLQQVIEELGLKGIRCEHLRAEDAGRDKKHREKYDYVTARAVARLSVLSEYCLPLAKKGGQFIALKGSKFAEEITEGEAAVKILGGKIISAEPVKLPGLDDGRAIIKIAKIKSTPAQYPRKAGTPEKQPLGAK